MSSLKPSCLSVALKTSSFQKMMGIHTCACYPNVSMLTRPWGPYVLAKGFKEDCEKDGGKANWANLHYNALKRGLMRGPGHIFCT